MKEYKWFKRFYRVKPKQIWINDKLSSDFESELGHIDFIEFRLMRGVFLGLKIGFKFGGCGVFTDFVINMYEDCKYKSIEERNAIGYELLQMTKDLLDDAKVECVSELKNKPVEVYSKGLINQGFRILTEVL